MKALNKQRTTKTITLEKCVCFHTFKDRSIHVEWKKVQ